MAPQCPEAARACLHWLPEVIIQEQLALEVLGGPVLVSVGSSPPGPSTGSTVVLREQPAVPEQPVNSLPHLLGIPNVGATHHR